MLFRETLTGAKLSAWRMYVQKRAVNNLLEAYKSDTHGDGHAYVAALLAKLRTRFDAARSTDAQIRAQQAIDGPIKQKQIDDLKKRQAERQAQFKRLDDKLTSWGF